MVGLEFGNSKILLMDPMVVLALGGLGSKKRVLQRYDGLGVWEFKIPDDGAPWWCWGLEARESKKKTMTICMVFLGSGNPKILFVAAYGGTGVWEFGKSKSHSIRTWWAWGVGIQKCNIPTTWCFGVWEFETVADEAPWWCWGLGIWEVKIS